MIILLVPLMITLIVTVIIDVILYDYDVSYRIHRVLACIIYFTVFTILIVSLITCVSISNSSYKYTSTSPIVIPILLPVH